MIVVAKDREIVCFLESEADLLREVCFFLEERKCVFFRDFNVPTPQRRSSPHTHTHTPTLTNRLILTHTHDWPTVASRASGSRGVFRVLAKKFWGPKSGQQNIF